MVCDSYEEVMKNIDEHIEILIARCLSGEASPAEKTELLDWMESAEEHSRHFFEMEKLWKGLGIQHQGSAIDIEKEWTVFKNKLSRGTLREKTFRIMSNRTLLIRAAAAAMLIVAVIYGIANISGMGQKSLITEAESGYVLLPDSSRVFLNAWSTLKYPKRFGKKARQVSLAGEGYFEVIHNSAHPFKVHTARVQIQVLGTSFNVSAYESNALVEVVVSTGKVAMSSEIEQDHILILDPGNKGVYTRKDGALSKSLNTNINYMAWKTRKLVFINEELETIIKTINQVYHSSIIIEDEALRSCRMTSTFDQLPLDAILNILKSTLDLELETDKEQIIIRGNGC